MDCINLTDLQCAYELSSQQDTKIILIFFTLAISLFFIFKMDNDRIKSFKTFYYVSVLKVIRWLSFVYLASFPITILLLRATVDYELAISFLMIYYFPIIIMIILMLLLFVIDKLFSFLGFQGVMDFYNRTKSKK